MRVLLVEPLGVLRASLGDQSAVVLQNRYFVRYLRLQTINSWLICLLRDQSGIWVGWSVEVFGRAAPSRAAPVVTSERSCGD